MANSPHRQWPLRMPEVPPAAKDERHLLTKDYLRPLLLRKSNGRK